MDHVDVEVDDVELVGAAAHLVQHASGGRRGRTSAAPGRAGWPGRAPAPAAPWSGPRRWRTASPRGRARPGRRSGGRRSARCRRRGGAARLRRAARSGRYVMTNSSLVGRAHESDGPDTRGLGRARAAVRFHAAASKCCAPGAARAPRLRYEGRHDRDLSQVGGPGRRRGPRGGGAAGRGAGDRVAAPRWSPPAAARPARSTTGCRTPTSTGRRVVVTLSDERCVPTRQPQRQRPPGARAAARRRGGQGAPACRCRPDAEPAAARRSMPFDAVMLGMGEDGHIASLIPGSPVLDEAWTRPADADRGSRRRASATPPVRADHADPRRAVAGARHLPLDRRRG